jgi:membrane-associated phospholipid phosphatase
MLRKYRLFSILFFCGLFSVNAFSQKDSTHSSDTLRFDKYYIYSGILDARDEVIAPFHWNGGQWATFGVLAVGESVLIFAGGDKSIQLFAQKNRNSTTNFIENNIGDPFGDGLYPAIIVGSSYIFGCIFHKNHLKKMAMLTAKSVIISGLTTTIIKSIAERDRPFQDNPPNPLHWKGPVGMFNNNSFPSGHSTVAFATATTIALTCPHPLIIPILAYSLATVTALGRINGNFHWGSDVIMGAAIGYFTSRLVVKHNNWGKCLRNKNIRRKTDNGN